MTVWARVGCTAEERMRYSAEGERWFDDERAHLVIEPNFAEVAPHPTGGGATYWRHPSADIDDSAEIGAGCYIGPAVTIRRNVVIGPNTVIGDRGYGYLDDGTYRIHPHGVCIGEGSRVGANTCIDAGRHRTTWILDHVLIDNLVHIAHNVIIGPRTRVIAGAEISGSCDIGADVTISPNACINDHVAVGDGAHIGLGAVVVKGPVPAGEVWVGNPARKLR